MHDSSTEELFHRLKNTASDLLSLVHDSNTEELFYRLKSTSGWGGVKGGGGGGRNLSLVLGAKISIYFILYSIQNI